MKGSKRTLLLVLVLVLVLGAGYYFLVLKKKPKTTPKPKAKAPLAELQPSPSPTAAPAPSPMPPAVPTPAPVAKPGATPAPISTPAPGTPPGLKPLIPPVPGAPTPPPSIPRTESLPTESQPVLEVITGNPIRTAEGTTLTLDQVNLNYAGTAKVKFFWQLINGSADDLRILDPQNLKTRILIEDIDAPTDFTLKVSANDGKTESSSELKITAYPAKLTKVAQNGGAWVGISHMGVNWVAMRGTQLDIFNPAFEKITSLQAPFPPRDFFAIQTPQGKGAIYVQSQEGSWAVIQSDEVAGSKVSLLPMVSKTIRKVVPFTLDNAPYAFGLLERGVELWNLSDPTHPRLKSSLGAAFLKNPLYLSFLGRNLYVADEEMIHLLDFQTGNLLASLPAGGSITALQAFTWEDKKYLLAAIGTDRSQQARKDFGMRLFDIAEDGRLSGEKRLPLKGNPPVRDAYVVPGSGKALVGVDGTSGLELRMVNLRPLEEIEVGGNGASGFVALSELETGKIGDEAVAVIADGNQLKILSFKPEGERRYQVSLKTAVPSILSAAWVAVRGDGAQVWVGDEGTASGGALAVLEGQDLKAIRAQNTPPGSFPAEGGFRGGTDEAPLLLLAEDIRKVAAGQQKEGALALVSTKDPSTWNLESSNATLGVVSPQGLLRPLGVAARSLENNLRIGLAIARITGNAGGAGLIFWDKPAAQGAKAFLQGDLSKTGSLIPLSDARDVAFTADGNAAFLAGGLEGVIAVDLQSKRPKARMSLGSKDWWADRVMLGGAGTILIATFIQPANQTAIVKIFSVASDQSMRELGTIPGLKAVMTPEGLRSPVPAMTEDELYLFLPSPGKPRNLSVYNLSNPQQPYRIAELELDGEIRSSAVAKRFREIFVALGKAGVAKLEFGF